MDWYYADASEQQQRVSEENLAALVADGVIKPNTLVWNETLTDWKEATLIRPDLFASMSYPPVLTPMDQRNAALPGYAPQPATGTTDPVSICALVFGILGILSCFGIFSIVGIVCGHIGRKRARIETVQTSNGGLALAGLITGYIGLAISAVVVLVYGAMIIAAIASGEMNS
jgi:hypothetical protein